MRSDRNMISSCVMLVSSLVDWEMRSDRNTSNAWSETLVSLVDWEMRLDRIRGEKKQPQFAAVFFKRVKDLKTITQAD